MVIAHTPSIRSGRAARAASMTMVALLLSWAPLTPAASPALPAREADWDARMRCCWPVAARR